MDLGITVVLTEDGMEPAELGAAVEERGYSSLYLPEHTHLPVRADVPPALVEGVNREDYKRSLDPLISLAMVAAVTSRIRLGTGILLVAQHGPIGLAKRIATLDRLSGGRFVLGVGTGWNQAEAEDHGIVFSARRAIAREHVMCMQTMWRDDVAEFHGEHMNLEPCWFWPKPLQGAAIPVLVGGGAIDAVFDAVCEYGHGWMPIGGAGLPAAMARLKERAKRWNRDPKSLSIVPFGTIPTPGKLARYRDLGIGEVVLRLRNGRRDEMLRELDAHAAFLQ